MTEHRFVVLLASLPGLACGASSSSLDTTSDTTIVVSTSSAGDESPHPGGTSSSPDPSSSATTTDSSSEGSSEDLGDDASSSTTSGATFDFCPTEIDVFGYSNVMFSGCGGASVENLASGLFAPGEPGYDATLAGRLQARIAADPDLTAKFGPVWRVRSCAASGAVMGTFVDITPPGDCPLEGPAGTNIEMCADEPAPVVLYSANNVYDRCHGGGSDTPTPDDEDGYAEHWASRFAAFVDDRGPGVLLTSAQHEWHGQQGGSLADPGSCSWSRPTWNRSGAAVWSRQYGPDPAVLMVGDLQDEFRAHHPCCEVLGEECGDDWFASGDGWVHFGCAGADALEDMWFTELKSLFLEHEFECD